MEGRWLEALAIIDIAAILPRLAGRSSVRQCLNVNFAAEASIISAIRRFPGAFA